MSTRDYIEAWWKGIKRPSVYERNYYRLFSEHSEDLSHLSIQFFQQTDDVAKEAREKKVFGRCHSIGHHRAGWERKLIRNSTLWLGYVDVYQKGLCFKTMKHTFVTWNHPSGDRFIFDQVLIKSVVSGLDYGFHNYYAVPIPTDFPGYVEDFLQSCNKPRNALNYSVFMDHITFASDESTDKLLGRMNRLRKKKRPG
jgi:hypothetical protein